MNFGDRLLKLRKERNISQETLANIVGVTRQTVSNWEMNITVPNIVDLKKIANALEINCNELLDECNIKNKKNEIEKNNINNNDRVAIKILKIIGIIFIAGIGITLTLLIIFGLKYNKTNVYGIDSIRCNYNENNYTYSISYNKKHQIINVEITGQESEKTMDEKWVDELNRYATSKEIVEPRALILYISKKYKENNGYCN